jgi:hypothetical protein
MKKILLVSSDFDFLKEYETVGINLVEIFFAPSLETAYLLLRAHTFDFILASDFIQGRVPGIKAGIALERDMAGRIFGTSIFEGAETPYAILSAYQKEENKLGNYCRYYGPFLSPKEVSERFISPIIMMSK